MNMLKMCLNPKVLAGLAVVGVGVFLVAPQAALSILPLLLLAACPLSMLLMGKMMMGGGHETANQAAAAEGGYYCPMHPEVRSDSPGTCPKCGMNLQPAPKRAPPSQPQPDVAELRGQLESLRAQQAALEKQLDRAAPAAEGPKVIEEAEEIARRAQ